MQLSMFEQADANPKKVPTMVVKDIDANYIAVRFRQIGNPQRFNTVLGRFRYDFPLTNCQEIAGLPWWVLAASQYDGAQAFAKRNGLHLIKE